MRDLETVRKAALAAIEEAKDSIIETGRWIWNNPEPGYREVKTSGYIINELRKLGLEVKTNLAMTGFRADVDTGKPGPVLAVLGELDSLILPNHPECDVKQEKMQRWFEDICRRKKIRPIAFNDRYPFLKRVRYDRPYKEKKKKWK